MSTAARTSSKGFDEVTLKRCISMANFVSMLFNLQSKGRDKSPHQGVHPGIKSRSLDGRRDSAVVVRSCSGWGRINACCRGDIGDARVFLSYIQTETLPGFVTRGPGRLLLKTRLSVKEWSGSSHSEVSA